VVVAALDTAWAPKPVNEEGGCDEADPDAAAPNTPKPPPPAPNAGVVAATAGFFSIAEETAPWNIAPDKAADPKAPNVGGAAARVAAPGAVVAVVDAGFWPNTIADVGAADADVLGAPKAKVEEGFKAALLPASTDDNAGVEVDSHPIAGAFDKPPANPNAPVVEPIDPNAGVAEVANPKAGVDCLGVSPKVGNDETGALVLATVVVVAAEPNCTPLLLLTPLPNILTPPTLLLPKPNCILAIADVVVIEAELVFPLLQLVGSPTSPEPNWIPPLVDEIVDARLVFNCIPAIVVVVAAAVVGFSALLFPNCKPLLAILPNWNPDGADVVVLELDTIAVDRPKLLLTEIMGAVAAVVAALIEAAGLLPNIKPPELAVSELEVAGFPNANPPGRVAAAAVVAAGCDDVAGVTLLKPWANWATVAVAAALVLVELVVDDAPNWNPPPGRTLKLDCMPIQDTPNTTLFNNFCANLYKTYFTSSLDLRRPPHIQVTSNKIDLYC
jgi:hypothetical protein